LENQQNNNKSVGRGRKEYKLMVMRAKQVVHIGIYMTELEN
jgi:hypothetical protein